MSLGYCGKCKIIEQSEEIVIYGYSGENWNNPESKDGDRNLLDGRICIYKRCLEEPEIHVKTKRMKNGRKTIYEKRIIHSPSISEHIINNDIIIEKRCKNEFSRSLGTQEDYIALILLFDIFREYQSKGSLPQEVAFIQ